MRKKYDHGANKCQNIKYYLMVNLRIKFATSKNYFNTTFMCWQIA